MQGMVAAEKHIKAKISLVGETAVGKTSLVKRFVLDTFDDRYVATVGTKVTKKTVPVMWRGGPAPRGPLVWGIMGGEGGRGPRKEEDFAGRQGGMAGCGLIRQENPLRPN